MGQIVFPNETLKPPVVLTDKLKAEKHGFNKKSFRKDKS